MRELTATKKQDRATTALFKAATSGEIFGSMILDVVSRNNTSRCTMGMAMLTGMSSSQGIESFSLYFETISFEYF
jgi:type VI protein secretion system component Hcp